VSSVVLNATDNPDNTTNANLTGYVTGTDGDDDNIGYAWDWRKENTSIAVLNMNFDVEDSAGSGETKDYTTYSNNGTVSGATWSSSGGWNGTGVYTFNGSGQYIDAGSNPITGTDAFTLAAWINTTTVTEYSGAVMIGNSASTEGAYIGTVATAQQGTSNSIGGRILRGKLRFRSDNNRCMGPCRVHVLRRSKWNSHTLHQWRAEYDQHLYP
jgi:hypothetical protein